MQEVTFHSLAFVLYLAASITFLINVENYKNSSYRNTHYEPLLAAAVSPFLILQHVNPLESFR